MERMKKDELNGRKRRSKNSDKRNELKTGGK